MPEIVLPYILNALLGVVMFFMKQSNDSLRERITKTENHVDHLKETTFKKDDFREFKDELFVRMDKMEVAFEKRLQEINKGH